VYAKIKVSQGLWWANTARPSLWIARAIKKGDKEQGVGGNPLAEVLSVRYYPITSQNAIYQEQQYDVYLTVRMKVQYNKNTDTYSFKRELFAIGTPVELDFSRVSLSGTVLDFQTKPYGDSTELKVVTLKKTWGYSWDDQSVVIGDSYFDGEEKVLEVIDKQVEPTVGNYNYTAQYNDQPLDITLTVKMKVVPDKNQYIYHEEIPLQIGKKINLSTDKALLTEYLISDVK
jgi:hypothetical protein